MTNSSDAIMAKLGRAASQSRQILRKKYESHEEMDFSTRFQLSPRRQYA
ncbi:hypothetical protein [Stieleria maiorica]|nr:hypothetical protein [Stieleria maiorica]